VADEVKPAAPVAVPVADAARLAPDAEAASVADAAKLAGAGAVCCGAFSSFSAEDLTAVVTNLSSCLAGPGWRVARGRG
jgi:hypothetical protein